MSDQTFSDKFQSAGDQLLDSIKRLASESNVRKIVISNGDGKQLLTVPMNAGILVGGVAVIAAPTLAAIAALATLFSSFTVEVVRDAPEDADIIDVEPEE